jgi:hypothetical protein
MELDLTLVLTIVAAVVALLVALYITYRLTVDRAREPERERQLQQRDFDLLKHISTLNVASLVLLLALIKDFSPKAIREDPPTLTLWAVFLFFGSLLLGILGLCFILFKQQGAALFIRFLATLCYVVFFAGWCLAFIVGIGTL